MASGDILVIKMKSVGIFQYENAVNGYSNTTSTKYSVSRNMPVQSIQVKEGKKEEEEAKKAGELKEEVREV
jgi:hypothetical protein